jgi:hypothetical protein
MNTKTQTVNVKPGKTKSRGASLGLTAVAAALIALPTLSSARAQNMQPMENSEANASQMSAQQMASRMVLADADLSSYLDAGKLAPGDTIWATLDHKVRLQDGTVLPAGARFQGSIVTDPRQEDGAASLAVRFTQAVMKDGRTIPIKATIVGTHQSAYGIPFDTDGNSPETTTYNWTANLLGIEQVGVVPHVNLYSNIASPNSGVFVATGGHNLRITPDIEVELAIAPLNGAQAS